MSDWVLGAIDGAVTTIAIAAGAIGASLSGGTVVVLGITNLVADGPAWQPAATPELNPTSIVPLTSSQLTKHGGFISCLSRNSGSPPTTDNPHKSAVAMLSGFLLCGLLPIAPFVLDALIFTISFPEF